MVLGVAQAHDTRRRDAASNATQGIALIMPSGSVQTLLLPMSFMLSHHIVVELTQIPFGWAAEPQRHLPSAAVQPALVAVNVSASGRSQDAVAMLSEAVAFAVDVLDLSGYRAVLTPPPGSVGSGDGIGNAAATFLSESQLQAWWPLKPFVEHAAEAQRLGESCQALIEWCRAFESLSSFSSGRGQPSTRLRPGASQECKEEDERKADALKALGVHSPKPTPDLLARMRVLEDFLAHGFTAASPSGATAIQWALMEHLPVLRAWAQQLLSRSAGQQP